MININEEIDKLLMSFGATLIEYINSKNIIIQDNEGEDILNHKLIVS